MALIVCPECNKQISDQAGACPHCGYPLINTAEKPKNQIQTTRKRKINVVNAILFSVLILAAAVLVTCVLLLISNNRKKQEDYQESVRKESILQESIKQSEAEEAARIEAYNLYVLTVNTFASSVKTGGDQAYGICRLTGNVWHNAIYKVDDPETDPYTKVNGVFVEDFNDALQTLFYSEDNWKKGVAATENREDVEGLYKQLMSPPDELEDLSEKIKELYLAYRKYMALALETEGSLKSFEEDFDEISKEFNSLYEEMIVLIPDYK